MKKALFAMAAVVLVTTTACSSGGDKSTNTSAPSATQNGQARYDSLHFSQRFCTRRS